MTTLFDITIQHPGWNGSVFSAAGWIDTAYGFVAGAIPKSFYAQVISGGPIDFSPGFSEGPGGDSLGAWFNSHTSGPVQGLTLPAGYVTTPNTCIRVYTRSPNQFGAYIARVTVSDQPVTPAPDTTYCAYGTMLQPSVGQNVILTGGLINLILLPFGLPGEILAAILDIAIGKALYVGGLCSSPPPVMPDFNANDWLTGQPGVPTLSGAGKVWSALQAAAWPYFCQCVPAPTGQPAPVLYPAPTLTVDPNGPLPPGPFVCDNTDLCTMLNQMLTEQTQLFRAIGQLRSDVQLIQRQKVPFAYVPGAAHVGLTGAGTLAVQGILGLSIAITASPPYLTSDMAPVASTFKFGSVSWGTADGYEARRIITHNPHLFTDIGGDVTTIGYLFEPGVTGSITELRREP